MNTHDDLLIEIGCEELPPKALRSLSVAFTEGLRSGIAEGGLGFDAIKGYASPRRLAALVTGLQRAQPAREVLRRGPALAAAYGKDGKPSQAALGFASSCGVDLARLDTLKTDKGEWLAFRAREPGREVGALLPAIIDAVLARLPIPRRMRWGTGEALFVRPVHWLVLLYGNEVLAAEVLGVRANRYSRGHRFHHPAPVHIDHPRDYEGALLQRGFVIADFDARRDRIRAMVEAEAAAQGGRVILDPALLDEVTALTEWPAAITGSFDPRFLELPAEVLIATMQDHQRYFPLRDRGDRLLPRFIAVANLDSRDPAAVRHGNERVIRPRLTDADFFWRQDRRRPLADRAAALADMVFQKQLGSLHDKTARVAALATEIAALLGGDLDAARRSALLSRCDLLTDMVGEFPELQGVMGRYYALNDGEPAEVATAIDEMYLPRFAGDALPQSRTGQALALADRLDTLIGIFGIGEPPTGEKDPYGLRRAALGCLRMMLEPRLDLDLEALLHLALRQYGNRFDGTALLPAVFEFMMERLRSHCLENGVTVDTFEAVLATRPTRPLDFAARLRAVTAFRGLPAATSLAAANKRIANLLKKAGALPAVGVDPRLFREPAEQTLHAAVQATAAGVEPLLAARDYAEAMVAMAGLRDSVDGYFDSVLVMAEDEALRHNRLASLRDLRGLFLRVADISRLQG